MSKKWMSVLALFFYAPKPKGATLTYSAVDKVVGCSLIGGVEYAKIFLSFTKLI